MMRITLFFIALMTIPFNSIASEQRQETPVERQAREIASKLRCPVCQGESVFDSHASIAREMKAIIIEKLTAGESEPAIIAFFRERYGDYVLMRPRLDRKHAFVWLAPFVIALLAIFLTLLRLFRRSNAAALTVDGSITAESTQDSRAEVRP